MYRCRGWKHQPRLLFWACSGFYFYRIAAPASRIYPSAKWVKNIDAITTDDIPDMAPSMDEAEAILVRTNYYTTADQLV
jgi:hypothetical protein